MCRIRIDKIEKLIDTNLYLLKFKTAQNSKNLRLKSVAIAHSL